MAGFLIAQCSASLETIPEMCYTMVEIAVEESLTSEFCVPIRLPSCKLSVFWRGKSGEVKCTGL